MSHGQSAHDGADKAGDVPVLNAINYNQWQFKMKARFRKRGVWSLVEGSRLRPSDPAGDASPEKKDAQYKLQDAWDNDRAFSTGDLVLSLDDTQQVHVDGIDDDPVAMWSALAAQHAQKKPGTRINAMGDLFFAKKQPDETLQSFQSRINGYRQRFHALRDTNYSLDKLEDELEIMASLRGLPSDYEVLKQSLSLSSTLTLADLRQAFASKDTEENDSTPSALYTAAPALPLIPAAAAVSGQKWCIYHKTASHSTDECDAVKQLSKEHQENRKQTRFSGRQAGQSASATVGLTVSAYATVQNGQHAHDWICDTAATSI